MAALDHSTWAHHIHFMFTSVSH